METCSSGTGVVFKFEKAAMNGDEMPDGLDPFEQVAFSCLRHTYFLKKQKVLSLEQARSEKMKIWHAMHDAQKKAQFEAMLCGNRAEILKKTELARSECRKNPTKENAIRLCNVIDGLE